MEEKIIIFDTTLRDGEQSPGVSMNTAEKVRLATQLEKLGVDIIEAGFPAASEGDFDAVSEVAEVIKQSEVAALCRATVSDIDLAWKAVGHAEKPRIHTFLATSDIHLKYKLKMTRDEMVDEAVKAVSYAKTFTENVEFSAEDGSRTDKDFLCRVFGEVIDAGAETVNLPDTVGYTTPDEFADLVRYVISNTPGLESKKAVLSVHCHNDLGLATANTLAAIKAGARQAEVTINGIGERAGNTSLEEVVMAIKTKPKIYPVKTYIETVMIHPISRLVSMITGIIVQPNKAIVGANAFVHEAGIHQDGVLKNPLTYEIMKKETIGLTGDNFYLGKHSSRKALNARLVEMDYNLSQEELGNVFVEFKRLCDKKKNIVNEDLEVLVNELILHHDEKYKLESCNVSSGTHIIPNATLSIIINGELKKGASNGEGPIDAAYQAVNRITGSKACLKRFSINALTGGTDAQGRVTVRVEENEIIAIGKGSHPDIIIASVKAILDALNRLDYLQKNPKAKGTNPVMIEIRKNLEN